MEMHNLVTRVLEQVDNALEYGKNTGMLIREEQFVFVEALRPQLIV
jgi:hypothetical protein